EANTGIVTRMDTYAYSNPPGALSTVNALWDPLFLAVPNTTQGVANGYAPAFNDTIPGMRGTNSNSSYAHVLPFGKRRAQWSDTFTSTQAVFGNRGPSYIANDTGMWPTP